MVKAKAKIGRDKAPAPRSIIAYQWIGFGLILWLGWLGLIAFLIWRRKWRNLLSRWNVWFGILALTFALWGILALHYPSGLAISDARFADVSLGGNAGEYIIGNEGVGIPPSLRLTILILAGILLIIPRPSIRFLNTTAYSARVSGTAALQRRNSSSSKEFSFTGLFRATVSPEIQGATSTSTVSVTFHRACV
jgi:hypothetical protein